MPSDDTRDSPTHSRPTKRMWMRQCMGIALYTSSHALEEASPKGAAQRMYMLGWSRVSGASLADDAHQDDRQLEQHRKAGADDHRAIGVSAGSDKAREEPQAKQDI